MANSSMHLNLLATDTLHNIIQAMWLVRLQSILHTVLLQTVHNIYTVQYA